MWAKKAGERKMVDQADHAIGQMVYELNGLTPEEI